MAMSMLEAGGLEIVTDGVRVADEHNPRGYYEYERVKTLSSGYRRVVARERSRQGDQESFRFCCPICRRPITTASSSCTGT